MPEAPRRAAGEERSLPDSRVDYVMHLTPARPVESAALAEAWKALERRFAGRVLLAGSDADGWRRVDTASAGEWRSLQAALQLVSRDGVTAEADLLDFRAQIEALAAKAGAASAAPEMRQALEGARELDRVCADADIQVALHVVGIDGSDLEPSPGQPFGCVPRADGVTLSIDVGRTAEPGRAFEAMSRAAAHLAAGGGRIVDDNGRALDERALSSIAAQVEAVRQTLAAHGIEAGSPLALRVFS